MIFPTLPAAPVCDWNTADSAVRRGPKFATQPGVATIPGRPPALRPGTMLPGPTAAPIVAQFKIYPGAVLDQKATGEARKFAEAVRQKAPNGRSVGRTVHLHHD